MNTLTRLHLLPILVLCFSMVACATETRLEPAPGADVLGRGSDQVVDNFAGVELIANPDAWRGIPEITQEVLPIRVIVRNRHGKPIQVSNRNFALVADSGQRYAAKAPGDFKGEVRVSAPVPYAGPSFYHHDFFMYRPFGYYPGVPRTVEPFYYDPFYYSRYQYWRQVPLPTEEMTSESLPEMVVPDGGEISGFIYFEDIEDADRVSLTMDLVEPDGNSFGKIVLPFVVM
ncbi:MAG: hypothetical protein CVU57_14325 [Deltaproteobacteria bacterium HGW-Deltaproteobacteria-15]|nr:MAG: hypothetical protein CVU57_14325 [Deltaproteobacteria bacterium HGW-Deltaproteobacteria-15]